MGSGDVGDIVNIQCAGMEKKTHKAKITTAATAVLL
jgi:hypothetical protein